MIAAFYGLYILITPANWSWLWFLIAVLTSIWQWSRRPVTEEMLRRAMKQVEENNTHLGGPYG